MAVRAPQKRYVVVHPRSAAYAAEAAGPRTDTDLEAATGAIDQASQDAMKAADEAMKQAKNAAPKLWTLLGELATVWKQSLSDIGSIAMGIFAKGWKEFSDNFAAMINAVWIVKDSAQASSDANASGSNTSKQP